MGTKTETVNVKVVPENDTGMEHANECAININKIEEVPEEFSHMYITICEADWDALEYHYDIRFMKDDPTLYQSDAESEMFKTLYPEKKHKACTEGNCCRLCTEIQSINVIVISKNDGGVSFAKDCALRINNEI